MLSHSDRPDGGGLGDQFRVGEQPRAHSTVRCSRLDIARGAFCSWGAALVTTEDELASDGGTDRLSDRQRKLARAAKIWKDQLVDRGGRNRLLYYRDLTQGTLSLGRQGSADQTAVDALLGENRIRISQLFPDEEEFRASLKRARTIRKKTQSWLEERGLQTLYVAFGLATWTTRTGATEPRAPVLLCEASLSELASGDDYYLELVGEWIANPTLLHYLRAEFDVVIDVNDLPDVDAGSSNEAGELSSVALPVAADNDALGQANWPPPNIEEKDITVPIDRSADDLIPTTGAEAGDFATPAPIGDDEDVRAEFRLLCSQLQAAGAGIPGFKIGAAIKLGNFSYAKLPMVEDIESAADNGLLNESDVLAAIADDDEARDKLRAQQITVSVSAPDATPPNDEFLVLDADSSQSFVINAAVAGANLVIEGPPGTGKSQTIANLIASLAARRRRVLFVAEKRAAIDAVVSRLRAAELGDIVLDLHDGAGSRTETSESLRKALKQYGMIRAPDHAELHADLERSRSRLIDHEEAMHRQRAPWAMSMFEVQSQLLGIPVSLVTGYRIPRQQLSRLDRGMFDEAVRTLGSFVELGGLELMNGESNAWTAAFRDRRVTSSDQARAASDSTRRALQQTLPAARQRLQGVLEACRLQSPRTLADWSELFALLDDIQRTLTRCSEDIFGAPHDALIDELEPASRGWFSRFAARIGSSGYRRALKAARGFARSGNLKPSDALTELMAARDQLAAWRQRSLDGGSPHLPSDLAAASDTYEQLSDELRALGAYLGDNAFDDVGTDELQQRLHELSRDQQTLIRLPELRRGLDDLQALGLEPIVTEAARQRLDRTGAVELLRYAWLTGIRDEIIFDEPDVGAFDGRRHDHAVATFADSDRDHIHRTAERVYRAVAEWSTETRSHHPGQAGLVDREARKSRRHLATRKLFQRAPDVLTSLKPCWAMSPLVVSQVLPREVCFDVVIFDEASQVRPADGVVAMMRAKQVIVAGDSKQLPPTNFFAADSEDEEGEESASTVGMDSVLDALAIKLPPPNGTRTLGWHYRSRDERLIAFSNVQESLYGSSLTTFPGVDSDGPLRHELVEWRSEFNSPGDSSQAEVDRVVELVQQHAAERPTESLGVIAMGSKHAERIDDAIHAAQRRDVSLSRWLEEAAEHGDGREPFFVKNLERVQGDERDAIILTIGYGRTADGRMRYNFGPVNRDGGERRLNVAVTRAKSRMTVVSTFTAEDMDPDRLNKEGPQMLRRYLEYAASGGATLEKAVRRDDLNPFERDVRDQLTTAGIPLIAQYGVSGYWIDFAAKHPHRSGRMVLAIECDGATYHSSPTARDRDRLRQQHLENLGWTFHRIWSTDWFLHRELEIERAVDAWKRAVAGISSRVPPGPAATRTAPSDERKRPARVAGRQRPERDHRLRPRIIPKQPIDRYQPGELANLALWLLSDTRLRTDEQLFEEMFSELGYSRRGDRIRRALDHAIRTARQHLAE